MEGEGGEGEGAGGRGGLSSNLVKPVLLSLI